MRYLSVCSGIEAATVAWHPLGWEPAGFAEIESFPLAVLAHHYPTVKNFGDMTNYKEWNLGAIDLLVGGTPCQSFSVAGLRKGLADPRGNLALVYCGILDHFRPKWCVWENVPGVLSSNGGRDFGSFLGALAELRYGFAYRVLDAQYFGVAQRRRRVFVVGYLGDWRPAAEVLFEPESLRRDTAPSRETGQEVAGTIAARFGISRNNHEECVRTYSTPAIGSIKYDIISSSITRNTGAAGETQNPAYVIQPVVPRWPAEITGTLDAHFGDKQGLEDQHVNAGCPMFVPAQPIALADTSSRDKNQNGAGWKDDGTMYTLDTTSLQGVAQPTIIHGTQDPCISDVAFAQGRNSGGENVLIESMAVRRLTPVECERLQGFPDNYTNIPWRKQPESPDGPRYKALGNSMAVPVMAWIGKRIQQYCIKNYDRIKVASAG
jgi:DNA (cytosine-5)-methyltransferase 1